MHIYICVYTAAHIASYINLYMHIYKLCPDMMIVNKISPFKTACSNKIIPALSAAWRLEMDHQLLIYHELYIHI